LVKYYYKAMGWDVLCCMANFFCNVLVKFGEGAVEAEQGAIRELAWKKSHARQHWDGKTERPYRSTVEELGLQE
jgi:hypothetical protein